MKNTFQEVAITECHPDYKTAIKRITDLYQRENELRSEFYRDYTRILHSTAYRRLKHKTQVFFATHNDHVCTRIEHVNHVSSISYTISKYLGLNTELTSAIAIGHDVGHAPFGHQGETVINQIVKKEKIDTFWHERNSLFFIENIETLPDENNNEQNLNLTYAVRDGIVCHCGEVDEKSIFPRKEAVDLLNITRPNQYSPYTWEGCIVKISDKIAYLGRDIEDAILLNFLTLAEMKELKSMIGDYFNKEDKKIGIKEINNTTLIHIFILDLCNNSTLQGGLKFSKEKFDLMSKIKAFNRKKIYENERFNSYKKFTELMITTIYERIRSSYKEIKKSNKLPGNIGSVLLFNAYNEWLDKYFFQKKNRFKNKKVFDVDNEEEFKKSAIYFISGMTDNFAISIFNELNTF